MFFFSTFPAANNSQSKMFVCDIDAASAAGMARENSAGKFVVSV